MRNGVAAKGNGFEMFAGRISGLADGFGDLIGLAESNADLALAIAHNEQCAEAETTTALDDFGASIDEDNFFEEIGLVFVTTAARSAIAAGSTTTTATATTTLAATTITTLTTTMVSRTIRRGCDCSDRRFRSSRLGCGGHRISDHGCCGRFLFNDGFSRHR